MNICEIKAVKDNSTQLIKEKGFQTSSGSKVCPRRLIGLINSHYPAQFVCCQVEKSIIKINSTTDHYTIKVTIIIISKLYPRLGSRELPLR